jgi:hypothetical protein
MSAEITPAEALHEGITDLVESSELTCSWCGLFEAIGVLDLVKTELKLAFLAADEDEAEGEFESDGVVGE